MKHKTYYYKSLTDDVEDDHIKDKVIDENYTYIHKNVFYKFFGNIYYWVLLRPFAFVYAKFFKRVKIENRKVLKKANGSGYFLYGNHTNNILDAFDPSFVCKKKPYIIVNPKNLNIPPFKSSTAMLGALPLPSTLQASKHFLTAVKTRIDENRSIIIYPEAKIWPCYTGVRPFKKGSFKYPISMQKPAFCMTTTYQKTKHNHCKIVVYVDGPFEVDKTKSPKEQEEQLEQMIFETMSQRSKKSDFQTHKYIKLENDK